MRWWYVIVLVLGIFVGIWIWIQFGKRTSTRVSIVEGNRIQLETLNEVSSFMTNKNGKNVKVVQVLGRVRSWNPENAVLEFSQGSKIWRVVIDLTKAVMLVNSLKVAGNSFSVNDQSDPNWKGGFCPGDEVVLKLNSDEVMSIINNGYRYCGFKDK
ncbi:MAG: hypothetical protein WC503_02730 [Candidatus Shapirobacteria bacterium]